MTTNRPIASALLVASGLVLLAGCPESTQSPPLAPPTVPSTPATTPTPPPAPPPPPATKPTTGWGAVSVGSSFETVTKTHMANGVDFERTSTQTVVGFDPDGVRVRVTASSGGVAEPETEPKFLWPRPDPDAKKPETTKETLAVAGKSYECEVTTETTPDSTVKTWRAKELPVPVKVEVKGPEIESTSTLVKVDLK